MLMNDNTLGRLMNSVLNQLSIVRSKSGNANTTGLNDNFIEKFSKLDPSLSQAVDEAVINQNNLINDFGSDVLKMDEQDLISKLQIIGTKH